MRDRNVIHGVRQVSTIGLGLYSEGVHLSFVFLLFFSQIGPCFCSSFLFLFLFSSLSFISAFILHWGQSKAGNRNNVLGLVACPSKSSVFKKMLDSL